MTVCHRRHDGRWLRLHVPVLPVLLVPSPLLLLAVLVGLVHASPPGWARWALRGTGRLPWALPGTRIEVEQGRTAVLVRVR